MSFWQDSARSAQFKPFHQQGNLIQGHIGFGRAKKGLEIILINFACFLTSIQFLVPLVVVTFGLFCVFVGPDELSGVIARVQGPVVLHQNPEQDQKQDLNTKTVHNL